MCQTNWSLVRVDDVVHGLLRNHDDGNVDVGTAVQRSVHRGL